MSKPEAGLRERCHRHLYPHTVGWDNLAKWQQATCIELVKLFQAELAIARNTPEDAQKRIEELEKAYFDLSVTHAEVCRIAKNFKELHEKGERDFELLRKEAADRNTPEIARELRNIAKAIEIGWDSSNWRRPQIPAELRIIASKLEAAARNVAPSEAMTGIYAANEWCEICKGYSLEAHRHERR